METLKLHVATLAAVAVAMAKQDVRYYLNGVCAERGAGGALTLAATNGHAAVAGTHPGMEWLGGNDVPAALILPRQFVELLVKAAVRQREPEVVVEVGERIAAGSVALPLSVTIGAATLRAESVDGSFPDWRRAMRPALAGSADSVMPAFDPAVIGVPLEAAAAYTAAAKQRSAVSVQYLPNGSACHGFALRGCGDATLAGVVMPLRDTCETGRTRAALREVIGDPAEPAAAAA